MIVVSTNAGEVNGSSTLLGTTATGSPVMNASQAFRNQVRNWRSAASFTKAGRSSNASRCPQCRHVSQSSRRAAQPADDPNFMSIVDNPPTLVRAGKRHGPGLIVLGRIYYSQWRRVEEMQPWLIIVGNSPHTHHSFRARNMASPTSGLEIETHSQIRGSTSSISSPSATSR